MNEMSKAPSPTGLALRFIALSLIWGSSFLFMKIGLEGLSPGQVALGRMMLGALALITMMAVTRRRWPRDPKLWLHMVFGAAVLCAIPYSLFAWAELTVPSAVASIINATTPIMTLLLVPIIMPSERLSRPQIVGLAIGIAGVVMLVGPWRIIGSDGTVSLPGILACLGATFCYGVGSLYMRRFVVKPGSSVDSLTIAAMQITLATALLLVFSPFTAMSPIHLSTPVVLAMLGLGVLGTGIAYIWNTTILSAWGAARTSTVTYLTPVVGVTLGVAFLGETLHWNEPLGGLVVILGILASQGRLRIGTRA